MIFVTIGTQLPFNRLVSAVDAWAEKNSGVKVLAQIGPGAEVPQHIESVEFLKPSSVPDIMKKSELIVSHAGMGSVLTALRYQRPIVIIPRKASLGEHRNEHQMATAKWLADRPGVTVCWDEQDLGRILDNRHLQSTGPQLSEFASDALIQNLRKFIQSK